MTQLSIFVDLVHRPIIYHLINFECNEKKYDYNQILFVLPSRYIHLFSRLLITSVIDLYLDYRTRYINFEMDHVSMINFSNRVDLNQRCWFLSITCFIANNLTSYSLTYFFYLPNNRLTDEIRKGAELKGEKILDVSL